jgi:hypothetical protein
VFPVTNNSAHGRIDTQKFGVVPVFVSSRPSMDRLLECCQEHVVRALASTGIGENDARRFPRPERFVQIIKGQKPRVAPDLRPVEIKPELVVKLNAKRALLPVAHRMLLPD